MGIFDRLKDGFDLSDISGIISDLQKEGFDFKDLLNGDFLKQNTNFSGLDDLKNKLGVSDLSQITKLLENKDEKEKADNVINDNTDFSSLAEMLKKAMNK